MSWHYSQALVAEFSAENSSAGKPSAPLSLTTTPGASSCNGKTTAALIPFRCGTTFAPSTGHRGLDAWMSSRVGSPVRTYPQQVKAQASPASAPASGAKWQGSFAKWDRDTSSWKTHQCSLLGGWESFSETWPRWGLMRAGVLPARTMSAPLTNGTGYGSLPTPTASGGGSNKSASPNAAVRPTLDTMARKNLWPTIRSSDADKGGRGGLIQAVRGNPNSHYKTWPTPHGFSKDGKSNGPSGNELGRAVNQMFATPTATANQLSPSMMKHPGCQMWQTPVADDAVNRENGKMNSRGEPKLSAQVKMWPTPAARDHKGANSREHCETNGTGRKHMDQLANAIAHPDLYEPVNSADINLPMSLADTAAPTAVEKGSMRRVAAETNCRSRLEDQVAQKEGAGGSLNPTWVEWLMGWPLAWTDLKPLATDKFQQWLRSHGEF